MQNKVYVQTQSDYDAWIASQPKRDFPGDKIPEGEDKMKGGQK
jgi:heme/copper-type cytochrome/quinol oxidase subunit 2